MKFNFVLVSAIFVNVALGFSAPKTQHVRDLSAESKLKSRFLNFGSSSSSGSIADSEISLGALNTLIGGDSSSSTLTLENASYLTLGIIVLVPLIIGLALLFYLIGGSGSGLTSLRRTDLDVTGRDGDVSYNPYAIDWETFSILDWIAIAEETWKKFEPGNLDCQKRLVCEIHQNTPKFGFVAKRMVDAFSYLEYAQVLRLPEQLKTIIEGYLDAADRGRSMKKDCGEVYSGCDFSVSKIVDRVSHNEI